MVAHRAVVARAAAEAGGRAAAGAGPAGPVRDPVRAAHRHSVGVPAAGTRVRLGHDVLAPPGGLKRGRCMGPAAPAAAEQAAVQEPAGLVPGGDRLLPRQSGSTGPKGGPSPVDRARPGSKHHILTDGQGIPLAVSLTGGNRNASRNCLPLLEKIPAVTGVVGRPHRRPDTLFADRGYDHDKYRRPLRQRGIRPVIAERDRPHGTGLGTFRQVVERTISWLHGFRRLRIRWERRDDIHEAFLGLAVCLITHRHAQLTRPKALLGSVRGRLSMAADPPSAFRCSR